MVKKSTQSTESTDLVNAKEAAEIANVSPKTINRWSGTGVLKPQTIDKGSGQGRPQYLYLRSDVEKLAKEKSTPLAYNPNQARHAVGIDDRTRDRLEKLTIMAAGQGDKVSMSALVCGAVDKLTDEQLIALGKKWSTSSKHK